VHVSWLVGEMNCGTRNEELTRLKRELAKVKQERDFLKDAVVYFAKESK
jgi:transposase